MKHTPGPLPSSCLTCRQRKRKCDKAQPACHACQESGFKCLGYDYIAPSRPGSKNSKSRRALTPRLFDCINGEAAGPTLGVANPSLVPLVQPIVPGILPAPSPLETHIIHEAMPLLLYRRCSPPTDSQTPLATGKGPSRSPSSVTVPPDSRNSGKARQEQLPSWLLEARRGNIDYSAPFKLPPEVSLDPVQSGKLIEFIVTHYEPLLKLVFFRPTRLFLDNAKKGIILRLHSSSLAHWSMYIGARIFHALMRDGRRADLRYLQSCLGRLDRQLHIKSGNERSLDELANSMSNGLELALLNMVASNTQAGYTLLKKLAPTFLQLAFADVNLWRIDSESITTSVSFSHVLISRMRDLRSFMFIDTITSLTFGVAPLIEYDTSSPLIASDQLEHGLANGAVPELTPKFTYLIAKINAWRAKNPGRAAPENVWKSIEAETRAYERQWGMKRDNEIDGWEVITRVAVLEGWRHAVLVYLYMGMCGVSSDDRRVQSSVRQIIQLLKVLGQEATLTAHFFIPCLMASICTPNERHRALLNESFLKAEATRPWLFKAIAYKPVIDHLWHGVAANGGPVRWDNYVDSRRVMLPLERG